MGLMKAQSTNQFGSARVAKKKSAFWMAAITVMLRFDAHLLADKSHVTTYLDDGGNGFGVREFSVQSAKTQ